MCGARFRWCLKCAALLLICPLLPRQAMGAPAANVVQRMWHSQGWVIRETPNFWVYTLRSQVGTDRLPAECERLRERLQRNWFGQAETAWSPKCQIVVYPTITSYCRQLGNNGAQSSGCASLAFDQGRVTSRRVDLRADAGDWFQIALPHELTHVVLADRFSTRQIPRWADEGIATLSEPPSRQAEWLTALRVAADAAQHYSPGELMNVAQFPAAARRDAFYAHSALLVDYLVKHGGQARFLDFVAASMERGAHAALREIYGLSEADLHAERLLAALELEHEQYRFAVRGVPPRNQPPDPMSLRP